MALIVEDGTGVVGANTYISLDEAKQYAQDRGRTYTQTDPEIEGFIIDAKDYLESFRRQYSGQKVSSTQSLQYPRTGSTVDGVEFPDNEIPNELKYAQCQLAMDSSEIGGLMPSSDGYAVASEEVDVIKIEYAAGGRLSGTTLPATPQFPKAQAWIDALLGLSGAFITTIRV